MKARLVWVIAFALPVLMPIGLPSCSPEKADAAALFVAREAINNWPLVEGQPLPAVYAPAREVRLTACRGEYESASVVLTTDVLLPAVLLAAETKPALPVDVKAVVPVMRSVTWDRARINCLLMHDPNLVKQSNEPPASLADLPLDWTTPWVTRAEYVATYEQGKTLWAREPIDTATLQAQDVTDRAQWWLTVHVPEKAAPGLYVGSVRVLCAGKLIGEIPLTIKVPAFDLLPDPLIRSIYYPTYAQSTADPSVWERYHAVTDEQYLAENRDMAEHGCMTPTLYEAPRRTADGTLDWTLVDHLLSLREQAGLPKGLLFAFDCPPMIQSRTVTAEEYTANMMAAHQVAEGAAERGYTYCVMGADEFSGEALKALHDTYASLREGGTPIWVAGYAGYSDVVGDVLDYAIVSHIGALVHDQQYQWQERSLNVLVHPDRWGWYALSGGTSEASRRDIAATHRYGHKVLTYMDPPGGWLFAEDHRRWRGLGLWKYDVDGTMTWAYVHINSATQHAGEDVSYGGSSFVVRGPVAPFDSLAWEGYREAADDSRYLATLQAAIARGGPQAGAAQAWLDDVREDVQLDAWRSGMIRWIERLKGE